MVYHSQPATTPPALVPAMLERRRGAISTRGAVRGDDCSVVDAGVDHSMVRAAPKRGARCGSRPLQFDRRRKPRRRRVDHRMIDSGIDHRTVVAAHGGGRGAAAKLSRRGKWQASPLSFALHRPLHDGRRYKPCCRDERCRTCAMINQFINSLLTSPAGRASPGRARGRRRRPLACNGQNDESCFPQGDE